MVAQTSTRMESVERLADKHRSTHVLQRIFMTLSDPTTAVYTVDPARITVSQYHGLEEVEQVSREGSTDELCT